MSYIGSNRLFNITSKGDSCFVRYSAYADGTDFTKTWSEGQIYIGIATGQVAPTDKSKYVWSRGVDGKSAYDIACEIEQFQGTVQEWLDSLKITVVSVTESIEDGGSNIVTFSDGTTLTIKNGSTGGRGEKGDSYILTEADKAEIIGGLLNEMEQAEDFTYGG